MTTSLAIAALIASLAGAGAPRATAAPPASTVVVGPGVYRPAFPASPAEATVRVARFRLDRTPVTNAQFQAFVRATPAWRRSAVKPLLAEDTYLAHWAGDDALGSARPDGPVVRVSWFAARAYCAWRGGRLPWEREWELAAAASATALDASTDPARQAELLAWYTQTAPAVLPAVGGVPNRWGASDLHGLVWEWIEDFNAALVSADARDPERTAFCGGAAATARDAQLYATFLRIAFRSALEARFTTANLGFRCAYDVEEAP